MSACRLASPASPSLGGPNRGEQAGNKKLFRLGLKNKIKIHVKSRIFEMWNKLEGW